MAQPNLIVFASGTTTGGGSGFENLVHASRSGILKADIVAVVSNHENGGVANRAHRLEVPFVHFPAPWNADAYQRIVRGHRADFTALSGWLKLARGLDPRTTLNIHPGPLPRFGGTGMYGHHVHEAVMRAHENGELNHTTVTMHFVTPEYDKGPVFFRFHIRIRDDDTADSLAERVNRYEHRFQPVITNLVVSGGISWNGTDSGSLTLPPGYRIDQYEQE